MAKALSRFAVSVLSVPVRAVARAYLVARRADGAALARDMGLGLAAGAATAVACAGTAKVALAVAPAACAVAAVGVGLVALHAARQARCVPPAQLF